MTGAEFVGVATVGVVVGLDLVTVPQAMTSRPLVAAFVGAWVVGHPLVGLLVGAVLELFALETLPVGAARYPDWGPPAAAAGALVADASGVPGAASVWPTLLVVVAIAAVAAWIGGWSMQVLRHANGAALRRYAERIDAGDPAALVAMQAGGFVRDVVRTALLTVGTLAAGSFAGGWLAAHWRAPAAAAEDVLLAAAAGAALWSARRSYARGPLARWLAGGLVFGTAGALLWL